jgi:hypothetical protein
VVWIRPHVERHVPVSATDLEFNPNELSPIALSMASIRQLVRVFNEVIRASQGEEANGAQSNTVERPDTPASRQGDDSTVAGVGVSQPGSKALPAADDCVGFSGADHDNLVHPAEEGGER